jgi:membrane glycosyltransferase
MLLLLVSDNGKSTPKVVLHVFHSVRNMRQCHPYDNYVVSDADDDTVCVAVGVRK